MNKNKDYKELARLIAKRSTCNVQVGAIIYDSYGIFSWGWNHAGPTGMGMHAEIHAIKRANKERFDGATILIYSLRKGRIITSKPCNACRRKIDDWGLVPRYYLIGQWWVGSIIELVS